jgi:hypothetical protein
MNGHGRFLLYVSHPDELQSGRGAECPCCQWFMTEWGTTMDVWAWALLTVAVLAAAALAVWRLRMRRPSTGRRVAGRHSSAEHSPKPQAQSREPWGLVGKITRAEGLQTCRDGSAQGVRNGIRSRHASGPVGARRPGNVESDTALAACIPQR